MGIISFSSSIRKSRSFEINKNETKEQSSEITPYSHRYNTTEFKSCQDEHSSQTYKRSSITQKVDLSNYVTKEEFELMERKNELENKKLQQRIENLEQFIIKFGAESNENGNALNFSSYFSSFLPLERKQKIRKVQIEIPYVVDDNCDCSYDVLIQEMKKSLNEKGIRLVEKKLADLDFDQPQKVVFITYVGSVRSETAMLKAIPNLTNVIPVTVIIRYCNTITPPIQPYFGENCQVEIRIDNLKRKSINCKTHISFNSHSVSTIHNSIVK